MCPTEKEHPEGIASAWRRHERQWKDAHYVYPVVSRRSRGLSIGINLNPDKDCNFDCIYCQVRRDLPAATQTVELEKLEKELNGILEDEKNGSLYEVDPFNLLPHTERGVRDIAFSGDGEPTIYPRFKEAVRIAARARQRFRLNSAKLVLLTNAAYLDKPEIQAALIIMDQNSGEIWAKLDAGTEGYFRIVNRVHVSFDCILENILRTAQVHPLVIQSFWSRIKGAAPSADEINAYCNRLNDLISANGQIKAIQLHTIARDPSESYVKPLSKDELNRIASMVKKRIATPVEVFYG